MSRINYNISLIRGIVFDMDGVLSASTVAVREDGTLQRHSNVKDGYAIHYALKRGLKIAIISGARDDSMLPAYKSLGLTDIYFHCADKTSCMRQWMSRHGLTAGQTAYVGDDIPDIPAMRLAGLRVTPADGAIEAKSEANYISPVCGGHGVARDLISQILASRGEWMMDDAYCW